jgi:hypothetical protein
MHDERRPLDNRGGGISRSRLPASIDSPRLARRCGGRVHKERADQLGPMPNMALQRTRRPRLRSGRSLRSLGSPLNARLLGVTRG